MSNWQIFGTRKCPETRKAERFFKSMGIKFQLIDLKTKSISKAELNSISRNVPLEKLMNTKSPEYKKQNLQYISHDIETQLLKHPLLIVTPIVRQGQQATLGLSLIHI